MKNKLTWGISNDKGKKRIANCKNGKKGKKEGEKQLFYYIILKERFSL